MVSLSTKTLCSMSLKNVSIRVSFFYSGKDLCGKGQLSRSKERPAQVREFTKRVVAFGSLCSVFLVQLSHSTLPHYLLDFLLVIVYKQKYVTLSERRKKKQLNYLSNDPHTQEASVKVLQELYSLADAFFKTGERSTKKMSAYGALRLQRRAARLTIVGLVL